MNEKKKKELVWPGGLTTEEMAKQIADAVVEMHNSPEYKAMIKKVRQRPKKAKRKVTKKIP